jgi:uncharacterized membrane protein (DUF106 family)
MFKKYFNVVILLLIIVIMLYSEHSKISDYKINQHKIEKIKKFLAASEKYEECIEEKSKNCKLEKVDYKIKMKMMDEALNLI